MPTTTPLLWRLKATSIEVNLAKETIKFVSAYQSPLAPMCATVYSLVFDSNNPVIIAGGLNAKHTEWNYNTVIRCFLMPLLHGVNTWCLGRGMP